MPKTSSSGYSGDLGEWLVLASALAALGFLPKGWQKAISAAGAAYMIMKML